VGIEFVLVVIVAAFLVLTVAVTVAWRLAGRETRDLLARIGHLRWRSRFALGTALLRDRRVPMLARAIIPALFLYLALPLDIVPDFIPVLGHLDDIVIAAVAIGLLLRTTPRFVLEEHLSRLEAAVKPSPST
jgi:uncharacterized membrane protein YkvA (DUF1232 family)